MKPISMIECMKAGELGVEARKRWVDVCLAAQNKQDAWVASLRAQGVKAAHPDDGWVDREHNRVQLVYPVFDDNQRVGELIALGDADEHRLVRVTSIRTSLWFKEIVHYSFEPCREPHK